MCISEIGIVVRNLNLFINRRGKWYCLFKLFRIRNWKDELKMGWWMIIINFNVIENNCYGEFI